MSIERQKQRQAALAKIGRAVLRLRLYWGWSQMALEQMSGVDQTVISRLERGAQRGLSLRRLAAIMAALRVGEVLFERPATVPQTNLEIMLYGDRWRRAVEEADRRLGWPRAMPPQDDEDENGRADKDGEADGEADGDRDGEAGRDADGVGADGYGDGVGTA